MEINNLGIVGMVISMIIRLVVVGAAIFGIVMFVRTIKKSEKEGTKKTQVQGYVNLVLIFILIAAVAWILNMGWFRFILTFLCVPIIHTVFWAIVNINAARKLELVGTTKKLFLLSYVTYITPYLFLPDAGDEGPMYFFFGLIRNDVLSDIMMSVASICFIVNIAILIIEIVGLIKVKKKEKSQE